MSIGLSSPFETGSKIKPIHKQTVASGQKQFY